MIYLPASEDLHIPSGYKWVPSPPVFVNTALSTSPTQSKSLWMFEWMFTEWKVRRVDGQLDGCIHACSSELQVALSNPSLLYFLQWQSN